MNDSLVACGGTLVLAALGMLVAGWVGVLLAGMALVTLGLWSPAGSGDEPTRNCPDCGAVVDGDACDYCGRSLDEAP